MGSTEQMRKKDLKRLELLRYMDDDFMTVCLADNFEGVELILRIILKRGDIKIKSVRTQDFSCTDPDDMNYEVLAERARYFKRDRKGVAAMSKIMEDMRNEAALNNARENAERLIRKGKMTLEEIAECVPLLSLDELREIEVKVMQLA